MFKKIQFIFQIKHMEASNNRYKDRLQSVEQRYNALYQQYEVLNQRCSMQMGDSRVSFMLFIPCNCLYVNDHGILEIADIH